MKTEGVVKGKKISAKKAAHLNNIVIRVNDRSLSDYSPEQMYQHWQTSKTPFKLSPYKTRLIRQADAVITVVIKDARSKTGFIEILTIDNRQLSDITDQRDAPTTADIASAIQVTTST